MEYLVFDTEASGMGVDDEVIQFAGIRLNSDFRIIGMVNWYCSITFPMNPEAVEVHGITDAKLVELANGRFFEDYLSMPENSWIANPTDLTFIAYNSRFDKRLVNQSLEHNGYSKLNFGRSQRLLPNKNSYGVYNVCAMELSTQVFNYQFGNKKLAEVLATQTKYTPKEIDVMLDELSSKFGVRRTAKGFHDGLYDALATAMLVYSNRMFFVSR